MKGTNIPMSLEEANVDKTKLLSNVETMAEVILKDRCTVTNPRAPKKEEIIKLLKEAHGG